MDTTTAAANSAPLRRASIGAASCRLAFETADAVLRFVLVSVPPDPIAVSFLALTMSVIRL
jgi:hypothetical protein